jgi:Protein phosphatase 2C
MNWKAIRHSSIGTSHQRTGLPCQDYSSFTIVEDILIGAVADGAGSAKYSNIGSQLAVDTTLNYLQRRIQNTEGEFSDFSTNPFHKEKAREIFTETLQKVVSRFKKETETEHKYILKDLSCTLLVFIATPCWMAAMQVGDGFIVMRSSDDSNYHLIFSPAKGEYANETVFVTSPTVFQELQIDVIEHSPKFIFASTDGLERVAIILKNSSPVPEFFHEFERLVVQNTQKKASKTISGFLKSEKVNSRTDDDKTILIAWNDLTEAIPLKDKNISFEDNEKEIYTKSDLPTLSAKSKEKKLNIRIESILQNAIFSALLGILFHYNSNLFDILLEYSPINFNHLVRHSLFLYLIAAILTISFNSLTYFIVYKRTINLRYFLLIILFSTAIGFIVGWMLYYPLFFVFFS